MELCEVSGTRVDCMLDVEIKTERLSTRPWTAEDWDWYSSAMDDQIRLYTKEPADLTAAAWLLSSVEAPADQQTRTAAILDSAGVPIGNVGVRLLDSGRVEFFYWIESGERGKGFATEILRALGDWASADLGAAAFELQIHPENQGSIIVAERSGYQFDEFRGSAANCADELGRVAIYERYADSGA